MDINVNFWGIVENNDAVYVSGWNNVGIYRVDFSKNSAELLPICLRNQGTIDEALVDSVGRYNMAVSYMDEIWFIPSMNDSSILILNTINASISFLEIPPCKNANNWEFRGCYNDSGFLWLFPYSYGQILKIDILNKRIILQIDTQDEMFVDAIKIENEVYLCPGEISTPFVSLNLLSGELTILSHAISDSFCRIKKCGHYLIYCPEILGENFHVFDLKCRKFSKYKFEAQEYAHLKIGTCHIIENKCYVTTLGDEMLIVFDVEEKGIINKLPLKKSGALPAQYCLDSQIGSKYIFAPMNLDYPLIIIENCEIRMEFVRYVSEKSVLNMFIDTILGSE